MGDKLFSETKVVQEFESVSHWASSYYIESSNISEPTIKDVHESCRKIISLFVILTKAMAASEKEAADTNERIFQLYDQLPKMIRALGGGLDEIRHKLPKR
jgi:hypothetical protein